MPKLFPEIQLKMQDSKLLMLPENLFLRRRIVPFKERALISPSQSQNIYIGS
jgi:hypothetical protein